MALYLGSKAYQLRLGGQIFTPKFFSNLVDIFNGVVLVTSDGYQLVDANGVTITAEEDN